MARYRKVSLKRGEERLRMKEENPESSVMDANGGKCIKEKGGVNNECC